MKIEEIRQLSREYAKGRGHVKVDSRWLPKPKPKPEQTYAQWFADSLTYGRKAGPPPRQGNPQPSSRQRNGQAVNGRKRALGVATSIPKQTDAYKTNPPGSLPPW